MKKVIHLVPTDTIGGVEILAKSIYNNKFQHINFSVKYISSKKNRNSLFNILKSSWTLAKKNKPDLLITSLWRSLLVGVLVKILNKKINLVVFLHSTKNFHWLEAIITRISFKFATEIWADSDSTISSRVKTKYNKNKSLSISVKLKEITPPLTQYVSPTFVFWGRLSSEKNISLSIEIFNNIYKKNKFSKLIIIGPDGGEEEKLRKICDKFKLNEAVIFEGPADFMKIQNIALKSSFYIQTSLFEGASISVMEAMQLGLVPIVTPVGEISKYCKNKENSLIIFDDKSILNEINTVISDNIIFQKLRKNAINTWVDKSLYVDDFEIGCKRILAIK